MNYPRLLQKGDTIGICAPSSGAPGKVLSTRFNNAIANIKALGYNIIETASTRNEVKCVSADSTTRAAEFMSLYENPDANQGDGSGGYSLKTINRFSLFFPILLGKSGTTCQTIGLCVSF